MGDANLDGQVDARDLNAIGSNWQRSGNCLSWMDGDFDGNGTVDTIDLNDVGVNWLSGTNAGPSPRAPLAVRVAAIDVSMTEIAANTKPSSEIDPSEPILNAREISHLYERDEIA